MNIFVGYNMALAAAQMEPRLFNLDFQLLSDAVLMLVAVIVLFFLLSYLLFNPARDFLQQRQDKIKAQLDDAKDNQEQALALKQDYERRIKDINKEAETILGEARKKALDQEAVIIANAKEEAARIIERANTEAELEKQKMADDVKKEMIRVAAAMAQKAVKASMDINIQDRLVEETLLEMGNVTWR